jgi:hypothetical protein
VGRQVVHDDDVAGRQAVPRGTTIEVEKKADIWILWNCDRTVFQGND